MRPVPPADMVQAARAADTRNVPVALLCAGFTAAEVIEWHVEIAALLERERRDASAVRQIAEAAVVVALVPIVWAWLVIAAGGAS